MFRGRTPQLTMEDRTGVDEECSELLDVAGINVTRSVIDGLVGYSRRLYPGRVFERRAPGVRSPKEPD